MLVLSVDFGRSNIEINSELFEQLKISKLFGLGFVYDLYLPPIWWFETPVDLFDSLIGSISSHVEQESFYADEDSLHNWIQCLRYTH